MKRVFFIIASVLLIISSSCEREAPAEEVVQTSFLDLEELRERGSIIAVTDFNSTNYFVYKGQPMGFHYELLKSFSDFSGIDVEIVTANDVNKAVSMLNSGEADLLAVGLVVNENREKHIRFTEPVSNTRHVLIQRKPNRWSSMTESEIGNSLIREKSKLSGQTVYVQSGSSAVDCIYEINKGLESRINIIEVPYEPEMLISLVARREIDYAVCDENIAQVNTGYFPVIDVQTALSAMHNLSWGVRKDKSDRLHALVNNWLATIINSNTYALMYAKYFRNSWSAHIVRSDFYTNSTGKVSPFDVMIKSYSDTINWDWRLLASLIYQESRFNPAVTSPFGAYGLMQVMPSTGRRLGIDVKSSPENNIKAGVRYISYLQEFFSSRIPDEDERLKFVIAAYNAGEGNILDAMNLARKHGRDPQKWDDNVAYFLMKKTDPDFYNDPVVQFGYCRGYESVNFVSEILTRYSEYRYIIPLRKD